MEVIRLPRNFRNFEYKYLAMYLRKITLSLALLLLTAPLFAQDAPALQGKEPVSLTPAELFVLSNVPELKLPDEYKGPSAPLLPSWIDNSTQPYFRPITWQSGYECGQSAGVAFNFCYEIDRLRNLPANTAVNQYPTHFTWDFLNNANNYQGVSFFDSWEIVRACGNMNVQDYGGGLNTGGFLRWISGYDAYYNGMKNRITGVKAIAVNTPEGLQTLKYWLTDHLNGSSVGGVANIYGQYFGTPSTTLPAGTPEAGKYVQTFWGSSPSHAWTICGFNDSIRYDFNNDGQYTNTIDINGDGVVDMHDWEIGGLKFANGYAGTGWSNQGFCYTMYKNLADKIGLGGIWNHRVYVVNAKQTCSPQLTMKVTLKHNVRNMIKVTAGISTDLAATQPSFVLEFPIFKFQGGAQFMTGGGTEADKTIEFGLDLAPLLGQIMPGTPARYFLQVQESDPTGTGTGEIVGWSLIDYTSGTPVQINHPATNTPLLNNATTRLFLNTTLNFNKPAIVTATLPPAPLFQPYNATLGASGGAAPYLWDVKLDYPETVATATFPTVTAQPLTLTNNNTGYAVKTLDFQFPFYKKMVNKVYLYADGHILFDDQPYTYPYIIDKQLLFRQTPIIAPFLADLAVYPSNGQGIWYEGNANYAIFRWKVSVSGMAGSTNLNFAVKIFPGGNIEYYYGDMVFPAGTAWTGGISSGDNKNVQYSTLNSAGAIATGTFCQFAGCQYPPEMTITDDGHFTGTPTMPYNNLPIKFMVTDNNFITSLKTLQFSTYGLMVNYTITSGGDSIIEFGETATISLTLTNYGAQPVNNISMWITGSDPYIQLTDSTQNLSTLAGGQTLTIPAAFAFEVSSTVPDNHPFTLVLHMMSQEQSFERPLNLKARAPLFYVTGIVLNDGDNGRLDPGESADMLVTYKNMGGARANMVNVVLSTADTNITLDVSACAINHLKADSSKTLVFHVTGGPEASFEHIYRLGSLITANNNFSDHDSLYLFAGEIIEDYETGGFTKFPWYNTGTWPWQIETNMKKEGNFSGRSGVISDSQESVINLNAMVLQDGEISFWKYVSCEHDASGNKNYDYFSFSIDNFEMGRWDGDIPWSLERFPVAKGYHTFTWHYHKDHSVSAGLDGVIIDYITFPLIEEAVPQLTASPLSIERSVDPGMTASATITVANAGGGIMHYSAMVFDTTVNKSDGNGDNITGSYISCYSDGFVPGEPFSWTLVAHNLSPDNEYIEHIKVDFPPGIRVDTTTHFSGGSLGNLLFTGTGGNGASLNWHGTSAGNRGVLRPNETATATITGQVTESFKNNAFLVYDLRGDTIGSAPHTTPGAVQLTNFGLANGWVTLSNNTGTLGHNQSADIGVTLGAATLNPGNYYTDIVVRDRFNNKFVVPVVLHVREPIGIPDPATASMQASAWPNPFDDQLTLRCRFVQPSSAVCFEIYDTRGILMKRINTSATPTGEAFASWNGTDGHGERVTPGVYLCRITAGAHTQTCRITFLR